MPAADPLHRVVDPPRDARPAHPGGRRGGHLHAQPQRAPRERHGPTLPQEDRLDVCHQGEWYRVVHQVVHYVLLTSICCDGTYGLISTKFSVQPDGPPCNNGRKWPETVRGSFTALCKKVVPCLNIPALSAARQTDLPMHSPISKFRKVLFIFSELSAIYFAQSCTVKYP